MNKTRRLRYPEDLRQIKETDVDDLVDVEVHNKKTVYIVKKRNFFQRMFQSEIFFVLFVIGAIILGGVVISWIVK